MNASQSFDQEINKDITVSLVPVNPEITEETSLYAVNWFDRKIKTIYNIYTTLTGPLVLKVGGSLHFKGKHLEKVEGDEVDKREVLLVVNYPKVTSFLSLVANKLFQLTSLLRTNSVKNFNFGFTKRLDESTTIGRGGGKGRAYLVHHFRTNQLTEGEVIQLTAICEEAQVGLFYAGALAANLEVNRGGKRQASPFLMDGIFIFRATSRGAFAELLNHDAYKVLKATFDSNYIAHFQRI